MRSIHLFGVLIALLSFHNVNAQNLRDREDQFMQQPPLLGERLPDVEVFNPDGTTFKTTDLRGSYAVLTFGCMTCPPSMWAIPGLEAVHRDYAEKGVKFYFIYKSLAHPELAGRYVQPLTQDERLTQARLAEARLGTTIPWIVDAIDNRLKHALGDRPNSQFVVNPEGIVIHKSAWSNPEKVREVLVQNVGPSAQVTLAKDLDFPAIPAFKVDTEQSSLPPKVREEMQGIEMVAKASESPFLAKLRAEADEQLLRTGRGKLYIGFHLDPIHNAHWNNLASPLAFEFTADSSVQLEQREWAAEPVSATVDDAAREFLIKVARWPKDESVIVNVIYNACNDAGTCYAIKQTYELKLARDKDAGGARGESAGYWDVQEFTSRMLACDQDGDGALNKDEAPGLILPHFDVIDKNSDGRLQASELKVVTSWVNKHHQAGPPKD